MHYTSLQLTVCQTAGYAAAFICFAFCFYVAGRMGEITTFVSSGM